MAADHDQLENAVAAYALDACDQDECEQVRSHIEGCASCQALLRRLTEAVHALPLATEEVSPPDRLRARILAAAAARPAPDQAPPARDEEGEEEAGEWAAPPRPLLRPRRPRILRRPFPVYGAAVAVLAAGLAALGAWNIVLNQQLNQGPSQYALNGTGAMSGASGTVIAFRRQDVALVSLTGLPQPAPGRVYEVWLIDTSGRAIPGGVFTPAPDGRATVGVRRPLNDVRLVAVTQEAGPEGVQAPTQKPELAGHL